MMKKNMWVWCSACHNSAHAYSKMPKWWMNLDEISFERLNSLSDYLELNKSRIDEWGSIYRENSGSWGTKHWVR